MRNALPFLALAVACNANVAPPPNLVPPVAQQKVTFHKDVEPILQRSCDGCHATGGIAPFALTDYTSASQNAVLMVRETAAKRMPPWGAVATSDCSPNLKFKH